MKLDAVTLPKARIKSNKCPKKLTEYEYLWCDENAVEESGLGIREIVVEGITETEAEGDAIEQATESAGIKKLYFNSQVDVLTDDRYYLVQTVPAERDSENASVWNYVINCLAADPRKYDAATDLPIW